MKFPSRPRHDSNYDLFNNALSDFRQVNPGGWAEFKAIHHKLTQLNDDMQNAYNEMLDDCCKQLRLKFEGQLVELGESTVRELVRRLGMVKAITTLSLLFNVDQERALDVVCLVAEQHGFTVERKQ